MAFIWDAKNNFILLHFVALHQEQSSTLDINWSSIVNDVHFEISSTPILLKNQYEYLLEIFYPKTDSKSLYSTLKHIYLHSLCQKIEDDSKLTLETVYELIRHARAKRINADDIEQLIKEWNFNYSSNQQKENKKRLFNILNRLRDYICTSSSNCYQPIYYHLPEYSNNTNKSLTIQKEINDEGLESMSTSDEEISTSNKLINTDNNQLNSNINGSEKSSFIRRRTRSLTVFTENQDNKVNIGVEWFVPKLKRQQRSSSLNARSPSPSPTNSSSSYNQNFVPDGILITTIDNDESSDSIKNSNIRQTQAQPATSWLPLTNQEIIEKERRQVESKLLDDPQLEAVSPSDSDSIEIQWSTSSNNKPSVSSSSHDLQQHHQQEHGSCKRQRLS